MNQQWRQVLQYGLQPILNQYLFLFVVNFCSVGTKKKLSYDLYKGFSLEKNGFKSAIFQGKNCLNWPYLDYRFH